MFHREEWIPAVQIRNERRSQFGFALLAVLATIALAVGVVSCAQGADREATCWLGGCSGVCVDPAGLVLTVKHCDFPETVDVEFRAIGKTVKANRVYVGKFDADDVVAFRLPPGSYPAASVAASAPAKGETVYSFGFPGGTFEPLSGTVVDHAWYTDGTPILATTLPARAGHSGGPLFNLKGELVGLCSTSRTARAPQRVEAVGDSNWVATARIHAAMEFVQGGASPLAVPSPPGVAPHVAPLSARPRRLVVFTSVWCGPCQTFAADYARNIAGLQDWLQAQGFERTKGRRHYGPVERLPLGWERPETVRACEVATGSSPKTLPTFWVEGSADVLVGYPGPEKLKSYIATQLAAATPPPQETPPLDQTPFERQAEAPIPLTPIPLAPIAEPSPAPGGEGETWSDVKVVVLVARQERGALSGTAARLALERASEAIRRKVQEATRGHADVELVAERLSPERFAAVASAAGLTVGKLHVVVLIRKQDLGAILARTVELIEKAVADLPEKTGRVPIEFVSERLNPEVYSAVVSSLDTPDAGMEAASAASWWTSAIAAVVGLLKRRLLGVKEAA